MSLEADEAGIWFIYDGDCPLCNSAAQALRLKQKYGALHLINARASEDNPLIREVNQRGLDLDEGMVIYAGGRFYHGKEALTFMASHGDARNVFTALCKVFGSSGALSSLTYPWMRGTRNWLLQRRRIGRIDNLNLSKEPIFKSIFGDSWDKLPAVMHKHYACRPYTEDKAIVQGELDVMCKGLLKILAPLMRLMGQIPAHNESSVPVTVQLQSDLDSRSFHLKRTFHFKTIKPYEFHSRMMQVKDDEVVEIMRFGLGWRMRYGWDGSKVVLEHRGYVLRVLGHFIPIPLAHLIGKGYAEELAIGDDAFDMVTHITHPWWGKVYEYKGRFKFVEEE